MEFCFPVQDDGNQGYPLGMSSPTDFTDVQVVALLDSRTVLTHLKDGGVQIEKSGIMGIGPTASEAAADWARKFAQGITRLNPPMSQ
jgi:hypothetical protein